MYIPELDYHCDLMNKEFKSVDLMDIETSELVFEDERTAAEAAKHEMFPADMVCKDISIMAYVDGNGYNCYAAVSFELPMFVLQDGTPSACLYKVELTNVEERRVNFLLDAILSGKEATPAAV